MTNISKHYPGKPRELHILCVICFTIHLYLGILTNYRGIPLYLSFLNQNNFLGYIIHLDKMLDFSLWSAIETKTEMTDERWDPNNHCYNEPGYNEYFWKQKISTALHIETLSQILIRSVE